MRRWLYERFTLHLTPPLDVPFVLGVGMSASAPTSGLGVFVGLGVLVDLVGLGVLAAGAFVAGVFEVVFGVVAGAMELPPPLLEPVPLSGTQFSVM